jgi:hypothetical protein
MVQGATGIFGIGHEAAVMKEPLARKAAGETDLGPTSKINLTAAPDAGRPLTASRHFLPAPC